MELEQLAQYSSVQTPKAWENCYEAAMEQYRPNWLDALDFEYILDYYGFGEDYYKSRLRQEVALLKQDATLNQVCWLMHYILFYAPGSDLINGWSWKGNPKAYAEHGSLTTNVVALLAGQPLHEQGMAQRRYDEEQIRIHKKGVYETWVGQHTGKGMDGISFGLMVWGACFMRCHMVKLGRLEYECGLRERHEYDHLFKGEPCYISIHIPRSDDGLKDEDVDASIRMAVERLEDYFPETKGKTKVFLTRTWLLSPELREILKPDSNIMKFQRRFTLLDTYEEIGPFLGFAFNVSASPDLDYNALPEDSSLRRALKQRLLNGEKLHSALGYFVV